MIRRLIAGAAGGALLCAIAFLLSRFASEIAGRALLVIFLFISSAAYVGFAVQGSASIRWIALELIQALVIGGLALAGFRGSPMWMAAGWAIHPLWDVPLHYFGRGRSFTTPNWSIPCVTFDLVVAIYVATTTAP